MVEDGLVYVVMTERAYPTRLSVQFLEEVHRAFVAELTNEHGADAWRAAVGRADKPYAYIRFERSIARIRKDFADQSSSSNSNRLKEDLAEVTTVMRRSITEVLGRGERLESVSRTSAALRSESDKFYKGARKANLMDMYRTYGTYAAVVAFVVLLLWWRFW
jgi:vesicle transport protein SEC22